MTGALVILAALIVIGLLLFLTDKAYYSHHHSVKGNSDIKSETPDTNENKNESTHGEFCCGLHMVCEKTGLSPIGDEIIYYEDEELDRFRGRSADNYTPEEIEEFRDVLLTLRPDEVAGWARSITLRKIELPTDVREELLMIVAELRSQHI